MIGDLSIPIEQRKQWVWDQIKLFHPEVVRENFPEDDPFMLSEIVVRNCYRYRASPGQLVMDIGANIGVFTALCALGGSRVVAYEPNTPAREVLKETLKRNCIEGLVTVSDRAVWVRSGTCGYHGLASPPSGKDQTWTSYNGAVNTPGVDLVETPCISLAEAVGDEQWDCVKMDIEGAEFEILLQASDETLSHINYLTLELHNGWADKRLYTALFERLVRSFVVGGVSDGDPRFAGENRLISAYCERK